MDQQEWAACTGNDPCDLNRDGIVDQQEWVACTGGDPCDLDRNGSIDRDEFVACGGDGAFWDWLHGPEAADMDADADIDAADYAIYTYISSNMRWRVPVVVANADNAVELVFGLATGATDGIDPALRELERPPLPPLGGVRGQLQRSRHQWHLA